MDTLPPTRRKRSNTIGFLALIAYILLISVLIIIGHKYNDVLGVIFNILVGICVTLTIVIIIKRIKTYKRNINN